MVKIQMNEIKSDMVRIVPENEIVNKAIAFNRAESEGIDVVLIQDGKIPVVKIIDFSKIEYQEMKASKNHNKPKKPKEISIGYNTADHDLKRLAAKAVEFIDDGHPTTLRLRINGREKKHPDVIKNQISHFVSMIPNAKPRRLNVSEDGSTWTQDLT